jgi:AcrR family transcriptional regulator
MGRPAIISREHLVDIARDVFQERGIRATTAEVAQRAGISEGALFKRFKTKGALLHATLASINEEPPWLPGLAARAGRRTIDVELEELALEFVQFAQVIMPCVLMAHAGGDEIGTDLWDGQMPPPVRVIKLLSVYFASEMRLGRIRTGDAEIVARCFVGPLMHFVVLELMHRSQEYLPLATETFVRGHIQLLLRGIR